MTTYDPGDQAERSRVVRNDERVRNGDTSTYLDHAHSDLGGLRCHRASNNHRRSLAFSTSATGKQSLGWFGSRS